MSSWFRITLLGAMVVVVFDVAASLVSRASGMPYQWASIGSLCLYGGAGFMLARATASRPIPGAAFGGAILGITDATLGWAASWILGPDRAESLTVTGWVLTAVSVVALAAAVAAIGGAIGRRTA